VWRFDLLSLPFFVAGVAAIIFGTRALWRQRLAVAYLFLAWPVPYTYLLLRELNVFTNLTLDALHVVTGVVHVATRAPASDGSIFQIVSHGHAFTLSVVSACSGVNGMVGFLLVGTAFGAIVKGPAARKAVWLLGGLALLWAINVARLLLIFWAGASLGEHFAINVLHPVVGLVTFNIGIVIMLLLLRPAGLHIGPSMSNRGSAGPAGSASPTAGGEGAQLRPSRPLAVPAVYSAVAIVVAVGLVLGITNSGLRNYDLVASATGEPKLASFLSQPGAPSGWGATFSDRYDWAKPYFGDSSLWYRYSYSPTFGSSDLSADLPVFADVINTSNLSSFSAYGVEACYKFHGYTLRDVAQVNLGGGINGQALSYSTKSHQNWSIVYWIWPVVNGTSTRYERIILYLLDAGKDQVSAPGVTGITNVKGSLSAANQDQRNLLAVRAFLVAFAREIIKNQPRAVTASKA
jgi:exosortase/archaeosortase family protein